MTNSLLYGYWSDGINQRFKETLIKEKRYADLSQVFGVLFGKNVKGVTLLVKER